ncbi:MAG: copper resistance protein CopC [Candidatus Nanopelagicales bacterium]
MSALVFLGLSATSATAHSELISSDPAEDSVIQKAPTAVTLTFGEDVQDQGSAIVVTGPAGTSISDDTTFQVDGTVASVGLNTGQTSGGYVVAYRIVSADGHIVEESFKYTVQLPVDDPSATPTPSVPSPTASPDVSGAAAPESDDSSAAVVWVLGLGAIGIALLAAVISVLVRRRRGRH